MNRRRWNQFEYAEYVRQTPLRTHQAHLNFHALVRAQTALAAGSVLYEGRESFTNYFNEYFYNFDLTDRVASSISRTISEQHVSRFRRSRRTEFFPASYDSPETVRSETWNPGVFGQQDLAISDKLSLLVGLRPHVFARAWIRCDVAGAPWRDAETVNAFSQNYSFTYKVSPRLSLYATHNRIRAANGTVTGGGVILNVPDCRINRDDFAKPQRNSSKSAPKSRCSRASCSPPRRSSPSAITRGDSRTQEHTRCTDSNSRLSYQPDTRLSLTASATFQSGHHVQSQPFFRWGAATFTPAMRPAAGPTAAGPAPRAMIPLATSSRSATGLCSDVRIRCQRQTPAIVSEWLRRWLNAQWQSEQKGNLDNQVAPSRAGLFNASLFYDAKRWTANLDFLNLANSRNWIHNGDAYTASQLSSQNCRSASKATSSCDSEGRRAPTHGRWRRGAGG